MTLKNPTNEWVLKTNELETSLMFVLFYFLFRKSSMVTIGLLLVSETALVEQYLELFVEMALIFMIICFFFFLAKSFWPRLNEFDFFEPVESFHIKTNETNNDAIKILNEN